MIKHRPALVLLILAVLAVNSGCLQKSITDHRLADEVQAFLDAPHDPSDEYSLTPEERAAIEDFRIVHITLKVQLVEETDTILWEPIGSKMTRAFALACRGASVYETNYYGEMRMRAEVDGDRDNFLIGEIRFENASERVYPELYNPTRSRN